MSFIVDSFHKDKLDKYHINIKTKYIVGNEFKERNTDNSFNDDIVNGIRCQKQYYLNNNLVHEENEFDSRIEYTFISKDIENKEYSCPNCGMTGKLKEFLDGCPYCGTYYNIEYIDKDLGSKYHYDHVLRSNLYRVITYIIDLIISLIISYIFIKGTSRTFNNVDISKIFVYGFILSIILYYFFYMIDAYVVLGPIKRYKDKINKKQQDFWLNSNLDKKKFYNNFNYEVRKYYYNQNNIIDYDIIDYLDFNSYTKDNNLYIKVKANVRIVTILNNKISSKNIDEEYIFKKNNKGALELKAGDNIIKCYNCGSTIDVNKQKCEYCGSEIKYLQEWIMEK